MEPSFGQIVTAARDYLGDTAGAVFSNDYLQRWLCRSIDEMESCFKLYQLPASIINTNPNTPVTLVSPATVINPVNYPVLANLSQIQFMGERPALSGQNYTPMAMVDVLPQAIPGSQLLVYTNNGGQFQFIGATGNVELQFGFFASGAASTLDPSVVIAVDDCLNFLAAATASKAGPGKGYNDEAALATKAAYGVGNNNSPNVLGGYLQALVMPQFRVMQQSPVRPRMYRAGLSYWGSGVGTWGGNY